MGRQDSETDMTELMVAFYKNLRKATEKSLHDRKTTKFALERLVGEFR